jgi:predicted permease
MEIFHMIVTHIMFPIFFIVGVGVFLHRKFIFDLQTLSKLNTFFLLPAVCFTNLYKGEITILLLSQIVSFLVINTSLLIVVSSIISKINRFESGLSASFKNSMVLSNAGHWSGNCLSSYLTTKFRWSDRSSFIHCQLIFNIKKQCAPCNGIQ